MGNEISSPFHSRENTQIIFVNDEFHLGGVEVLEEKVAVHLLSTGYNVTIACHESSTFLPTLDRSVFFTHSGLHDLLKRCSELPSTKASRIVLASFIPYASLASLCIHDQLKKTFKGEIALFHWIPHPRAFFFSQNPVWLAIMRKTFFLLHPPNCYFMNDGARDCHEAYWNVDLKSYPVLRIVGRNPTRLKDQYSKQDILRIVSVGRFVPFKAYNVHAPRIVRRLLELGIESKWDIWGHGPDEVKIVSEVIENRVDNHVNLRGTLDHQLFDQTVIKYDLFVGMGTAALEAAKAGVPTILAIDSADRCYGFLCTAPKDGIGERVDGHDDQALIDVIAEFSQLSERERATLGADCQVAAVARESEISQFASAMLKSQAEVRRNEVPLLLILGLYLYVAWKLFRQLWKSK